MRAFIFSLDAFVAFTLALVAIYSLIFFSSIPSSYYYLLTQGHFLAKDVLYSISTADCTTICANEDASVLDNIVFGKMAQSDKDSLVTETIGKAVPEQFGYSLEWSEDGVSWTPYYDTRNNLADKHADRMRKLSVSSQIPVFEYSGRTVKEINPYLYKSCMSDEPNFIITCDPVIIDPDDIAPEAGGKLLRLTIFI